MNRGVPFVLYERERDKNMPLTRQLLALSELVPQPGVAADLATAVAEEARRPERVSTPSPASQPKKRGLLGGLFKRGT
jgi:hypothetical protein